MKRKLFLLPGMSSPLSEKYKAIFQHIIELASSRGHESLVATYPGHGSGVLTFEGAIEMAKRQCAEYKPTWVIARSFGCDVAADILSDKSLAKDVQGAVLWGPALGNWPKRFPTAAERREYLASYRKYGTNISDTFLDDFPALELIIEKTQCNIRLVRGTNDDSNFREDLDFLAAVHKRGQASRKCEVVEIPGLAHTIEPSSCTDKQLKAYADALFREM
jgi:hypothetical protein